jgi:hypothetical protein
VPIENSSWITFYLKNHSRSKTDFFSKSGGVFISVQSEIEPSFPDRPVLADLRDSRMTKFDPKETLSPDSGVTACGPKPAIAISVIFIVACLFKNVNRF